MNTAGKGKMSYALQSINIIPLLFFGIIIMLLGTRWFTKCMYAEVEKELSNVACNLSLMFEKLYPGDYELIGEDAYQLFKGEHDLTNDYSLIDRVKADTGLDVTLFYRDTRILTTLTNENGVRIVGSGAPAVVTENVLNTGKPHFYTKTIIYNSSFFSYYLPLLNSDGSVTGMIFVGKPTVAVDAAVQKALRPLIIADIVLVIMVSVFTFLYTKKFVSSLLQIRGFLLEVSAGNLSASLAPSALNRNDELGEIAHSALNMQRSLRTLIEQDALTSLSNRRSGDKRLREIVAASAAAGKDFCIAIGDIDFFKKVNDTYGHECGDLVLKNVAYMLRTHMRGSGVASRWGGEEFLLIFEDKNTEEAMKILDEIMDDIRSMESEYNGQIIKVTMTFGLAPGNTGDVNALLRNADEKLYEGKETGRNRIIA